MCQLYPRDAFDGYPHMNGLSKNQASRLMHSEDIGWTRYLQQPCDVAPGR